ncbi:MAG TPA: FHA domain-containing protein, partial [Deltaproteobacteria bacterium]|nr:FHA domain-containing protein [Deltaproteobacteria bacterium]
MKELPVILVQLVHIQGPLMGQIQEFTEEKITIGRHPSCSVQFPTDLTTISRTHAELVREGNRYKVTDRSTNGTFVNGKRVTEAFLKDGDVIMFTEGGPKVSFLAKITDAVMKEPVPEPAAPKPPHAGPPATPAAQTADAAEQAVPVKPARPEPVVPPAPVASRPAQPQPSAPGQGHPRPAAARQQVQKVQAPLMVQFGPMLKSYKELPIVIGSKADADFVLAHPAIADAHAQIFFSQDTYWIKDLTGRNLITVGGKAIGFEAPLKAQDIISLVPGGPCLRFLGEGRLAEYEQ